VVRDSEVQDLHSGPRLEATQGLEVFRAAQHPRAMFPGGTAPAGTDGVSRAGRKCARRSNIRSPLLRRPIHQPKAALVGALADGTAPDTFGFAMAVPVPVCVPKDVFIPPAAARGAKKF
jgi:hypothetical protein